MPAPTSRFVTVSRRSFFKGTLGAGLALAVPLSACGNDDASVFTNPPATAGTAGAATTTVARATPAPVATTGRPAVAGTAAGAAGPQLKIEFTFAPSGGGRINNPFVAVWIEDASGALVRTVSLWYSRREAKYLQELRRWTTVDAGGSTDGAIDTVSSGSRAPGSYSVTWDGTGTTGTAAKPGDYFVCIEAAREHGPYELIREPFTFGTAPLTKQLQPSGELTAASVQLLG